MSARGLHAQDLKIGYGTGANARVVAQDLSLGVVPGEVLCLLGPNGAGKTTLFKTLLGLLPRLGGQVTLNGHDTADLSRSQIARQIAYVPQAQALEFAYSAFDLVLMGRTAHLGPFQSPTAADRDRAHAALALLSIADLAGQPYTEMSGGQRQLVLIARALAQDASLIVLDEPTASLDLANRVRVLDQVKALAAGGLGIVMSTHDPSQALEIAHKVAVMARGQQLAFGPVHDVMTADILTDAYGLPVWLERTESGRQVVVAKEH
jgi:iron complex transport system ATP-binding protein